MPLTVHAFANSNKKHLVNSDAHCTSRCDPNCHYEADIRSNRETLRYCYGCSGAHLRFSMPSQDYIDALCYTHHLMSAQEYLAQERDLDRAFDAVIRLGSGTSVLRPAELSKLQQQSKQPLKLPLKNMYGIHVNFLKLLQEYSYEEFRNDHNKWLTAIDIASSTGAGVIYVT